MRKSPAAKKPAARAKAEKEVVKPKTAANKTAAKKPVKKAVAKKIVKAAPAKKKPVVAAKAKAPPKKIAKVTKVTAKPVKKAKPVKVAVDVKSAGPVQSSLLKAILLQLEDAKAEEVITISINAKAALVDTMVVASGRSNRHVGAIADQLVEKLKLAGHRNLRVEGFPQCDWVLVDAGDVVVHLFRPEVRSFYNLEKLWSEHAPED